MGLSYAHGQEFLAQVRPLIDKGDTGELVGYLSRHWPNGKLCLLLDCGHGEAVKVALICLALTGTMDDNPKISELLRHGDEQMADLAERTMWAIWFRAGGGNANGLLERAIKLLNDNQVDQAVELLTEIIINNPTFAEAYNQRSIANLLKGEYLQAIEDCKQTLRLNEYHFCAMADLGHSYASLGKLNEALEAYRGSLELHPRMTGVRQTMQAIQQAAG